MAIFGGAAARARALAPTATTLAGPIRDASASTSSASRSVLGAGPRRALRRVGSGASRAPSTRASATPLHRRRGRGRDARASRRRERRALAKGEKSHLPDDHPNGGSRAVDAKRVPAPTGALVVDARGVAVGRDGAAPNAGSDQTAEAQTPDEAETTKPASDVGVTASQREAPPDKRDSPWRRFVKRTWARRRLSPKLCVCCEPPSWLWQTTPIPMGRPRCFPPGSFGSPRPCRDTSALEWLRRALERESANRRALAASARAYYLSPRTPPPAVRSGDGDDAAGDGDDVTHTDAARRNDRERRLRRFTRRCTKRCTRRETKRRRGAFFVARADPRGAVAAAGGAVVWTGGDGFDGNVLADVRRFLRRSAGVGRDRARV